MHKIIIFALFPVFLYASYNPFFTPNKQVPRQKIATKIVRQVASVPQARPNIAIAYFAFLETKKGRFALIDFAGKTIVVHEGDSLYQGNNVYKVKKLTSNYLNITGGSYRVQKVYFSSKGN